MFEDYNKEEQENQKKIFIQKVLKNFPNETLIYEWLNSEKFQTEYEETGEYLMYYEIDMPVILRKFIEWYLYNLK